jgi:hypothetical protein
MSHTDYERVMTSVLTPLEYCACGFTETEAFQHYGNESVLVYEAKVDCKDVCAQSEYALCKALFLRTEKVC